jgi:hypothetical protein
MIRRRATTRLPKTCEDLQNGPVSFAVPVLWKILEDGPTLQIRARASAGEIEVEMMKLPPLAQALIGVMIGVIIGATIFGAFYAAGTAFMTLFR